MTTKTSGKDLATSTEKEISFPSNFNTKYQNEGSLTYCTMGFQNQTQLNNNNENEFHWVDLGYDILSLSLGLTGFTFWAGGLASTKMCPVPSPVHREPICCECQAKFGGYLPVPRAKAALPYWVPLSLRPQNQIQKMVQSYIPKTAKACLCPCHRFGGHLPMPRDQAVMPYWVPQVLRSHKKVVKRQQNFKGVPEAPLDVRSGYNCWRICGEGRHLLKWRQLQALHQAGPVASGQPESPPASLLPLNLSLLTLLHALLRVMEAIRQLFWV